jgi:hypothetical protein
MLATYECFAAIYRGAASCYTNNVMAQYLYLPGLALHTIRFTWKYSTYAYSICNYHIRFTGNITRYMEIIGRLKHNFDLI